MAKAQTARTHCPQGHSYSPENTMLSCGKRRCRQCSREQQRKPRRDLAEKVWPKISRDVSGCWLWTGQRGSHGYGMYGDIPAHRIVYELLVGPIPAGLQIDHLCRVRLCVNPSHLEPVTQKENMLRGIGFAAVNARATACPVGHLYDEANTYISPRTGWRFCRACNRERGRRACR